MAAMAMFSPHTSGMYPSYAPMTGAQLAVQHIDKNIGGSFPATWSAKVVREIVKEESAAVLVEVTAAGITRQAWGCAQVGPQGPGAALAEANSDATNRAAGLFGSLISEPAMMGGAPMGMGFMPHHPMQHMPPQMMPPQMMGPQMMLPGAPPMHPFFHQGAMPMPMPQQHQQPPQSAFNPSWAMQMQQSMTSIPQGPPNTYQALPGPPGPAQAPPLSSPFVGGPPPTPIGNAPPPPAPQAQTPAPAPAPAPAPTPALAPAPAPAPDPTPAPAEAAADPAPAEAAPARLRPALRRSKSGGKAAAAAPPENAAEEGTLRTVLVIDDDAVNVKMLKRALDRQGLEVTAGQDGQDAIDECIKNGKTFDMILMDENMRHINGTTAAIEIRTNEKKLGVPRTPIIAATGNSAPHDVTLYYGCGIDGILTKPINMKKLVPELRKYFKHQAKTGPHFKRPMWEVDLTSKTAGKQHSNDLFENSTLFGDLEIFGCIKQGMEEAALVAAKAKTGQTPPWP